MADSASRVAISRWASVMPLRRNVSAAVLYSCRCDICGETPALSNASRRNTPRATTPVSPTSPEGCTQTSSKPVARKYVTFPGAISP